MGFGKTKVDGTTTAYELIDELSRLGFFDSVEAGQIKSRRADHDVQCAFEMYSDYLVDEAQTETLQRALEERDDFTPYPVFDPHNIAEGIRYLSTNEHTLAEAMFAREMVDVDMAPISKAIRSFVQS